MLKDVKMNSKENNQLKGIADHVEILNKEVGNLQSDVRWIKRIVYYMAGITSAAVGKILFFAGG